MLKAIFTVFVVFTSVSAQTPPVTITQPLQSFTIAAGKPYAITWLQPTTNVISQIWLAQGTQVSLNKIELIAQSVPTAPLSYMWNVDPNLPAGDYALELGTAPDIAYAGPFHITAATPVSNGTTPAPPDASPAASPASPPIAALSTSTNSTPSSIHMNQSTTSTKSSANMINPMALLTLIPIILTVV